MSFVLPWQPSDCIDLFVIDSFCVILENNYDDKDDSVQMLAVCILLLESITRLAMCTAAIDTYTSCCVTFVTRFWSSVVQKSGLDLEDCVTAHTWSEK